jgi:hypothetical protein
MQASETSSGPSSGTTSTSGHDAKDPKKGESEYLAAQAHAARKAMAKTWTDLKHSVLSAGDVREWTRQYPWIATGTALAAGVAAGYLLTPRDKDEFKEMWEKLKEKLTPAKPDKDAVYVAAADGKTAKAAAAEPSILSTIARETIKAVVPLLSSMAGGAMGSGEATASDNGSGDGTDPNPT